MYFLRRLVNAGAVGDVVATAEQLDRARRRGGAERGAGPDRGAGGARRGRRHRHSRQVLRNV